MNHTYGPEVSLPTGFTAWEDVPDSRIPIRKVDYAAGGTQPASATGRFVKGPLPVDWLVAIANSGHSKALQVALAVKMQADRRREAWVKPPYETLRDLGVTAMDLSRSVAALERNRLIEVQRRNGRPPLVRLVPWNGSWNV